MRRALLLAVVVLAGCGSSADDASMSWVGSPRQMTPPELPNDRLMTGTVRNDTAEELRLEVDDAQLVDADGHAVTGTVRFTAGFAHGLYSPRRQPAEGDPEFERRRLGELAVVKPGKTTPVVLSWRLNADGGGAPTRLVVGDLELALPEISG